MKTTTPHLQVSERLSDHDLIEKTKALLGKDRELLAWLLSYIGEIDARRLYAAHACSSMFEYAVSRLGLSEDEAYKRITAARLARRFPLILERISRGDLHLTGIGLLAPYLTDENHDEILRRATKKSKREIEPLIAELFPKEDAPQRVRKLPVTRRARHEDSPLFECDRAPAPQAPRRPAPVRSRPDSRITPSAPRRYKVQFTAGDRFIQKLEELKALLWHKIPGGDLEEVFLQALEDSIDRRKRQKFGLKRVHAHEGRDEESGGAPEDRPQAAATCPQTEPTRSQASDDTPRRSRTIPRSVRRAVFARDGMQCSFVDEQGRRCRERRGLEFQHLRPYARGGEATAANLTLFCRGHNQYAAIEDFAERWMRDKTQESRQRRGMNARGGKPGK